MDLVGSEWLVVKEEDGLRGLFLKSDLPRFYPSTSFFVIPKDRCLFASAESHRIFELQFKPKLDPVLFSRLPKLHQQIMACNFTMALSLLQAKEAPSDKLAAWLSSLPPPDFCVPVLWASAYLDNFELPRLFTKLWEPLGLTPELKWALSMAYSRSWIYESPTGALTSVMKPFLDMVNHADEPNSEIFEDLLQFGIRSLCTSDLNPGEQIFISYKPGTVMDVWSKFLFYGFVTPDRYDLAEPGLSVSWRKGVKPMFKGEREILQATVNCFAAAPDVAGLPEPAAALLAQFCNFNQQVLGLALQATTPV